VGGERDEAMRSKWKRAFAAICTEGAERSRYRERASADTGEMVFRMIEVERCKSMR
jgi:hypothetical protein